MASTPIRVLHVVHCLGANGRTGGMEYGVIKLSNALDRAVVQSAVCSTRPADPEIVRLLDPEVPHFECDGRRNGNDWRVVWGLQRAFRRFRPHIVHTHGWGTLIEGLVAARLARVPAIVHGEHGTIQSRPHQRLAQRVAWSQVDQVLSVSSRLTERLSRVIGVDYQRIRTIRNGVNLDRFANVSRADSRRELGLGADEVVIGTVGRLVPIKDHALLLNAFATVVRQTPSAVLLLAGDGPLQDELAAQAAALGIAGQVRFLGHRPDVERVFAALDVFVLSSRSEGMSNTILEAMASGVPVVATHVGGADELVVHNETGLLTPPQDAQALAAALDILARNRPLRARMAASGRLRAHSVFGLDRMTSEYASLYSSLAQKRGQRGGVTPVLTFAPSSSGKGRRS